MAKRISVIMLVLVMLLSPVFAAPMFQDVNTKHWAADAVAQLAAKGLLEGYPDGTFKGDRHATRWEVAMVVARLLAKAEQQGMLFASKEDLQAVKQLLEEYGQELQALGVRTTDIEKAYDALDARVTKAEHIRFYGLVDTIFVGQQMGGVLATAGQANAFTVNDWSNGRPLVNGRAVTGLIKLGAESSVPGYNLGTEFAAFIAQGETNVDQYWGVTPPYLSNPFTADSGGGNFASMNAPFSKLTLDRFWVRNQKNDAKLVIGTYNPSIVDSFIVYGPKNPNLNPPYVLPLFGANYNSWFTLGKSNPIYYEVMYSKMPGASNAAAPTTNYYNTNLLSLGINYNFVIHSIFGCDVDSKFRLGFMDVMNERITNGTLQNAGLVNIPARADPLGVGRSQGWGGSAVVGPQQEGVYGAALHLLFPNSFKLIGEYGRSKYAADRTNTNFWNSIQGGLARVSANYKPTNWDINAEYVAVSPTYDPFLAQFPAAQNIAVFLPYSTYYSNYYQMHDDVKYPNNREGIRANVQYTFKDGKTTIGANADSLWQRQASTRGNLLRSGFVEPFFPELRSLTSTDRGVINDYGVNVGHVFPNSFRANLGYYNYAIVRSAPINDDMNLTEKVVMLGLSYPFNDKVTAYGNYVYISYHGGFVDQTGQNFRQQIPSIAASYQFSDTAVVMASYKYYNFNNYNTLNSDWNGTQTSLELKMSF